MNVTVVVALLFAVFVGMFLCLMTVWLVRRGGQKAFVAAVDAGANALRAELWERFETEQRMRAALEAVNAQTLLERDQAMQQAHAASTEQDRLRQDLVSTSLALAAMTQENRTLRQRMKMPEKEEVGT